MNDEEIIIRYANNYNLNRDALSIDMVLKHWDLEKTLTKQLLGSTRQNRKKVFYEAYNTLYNELPWLQKTGSLNDGLSEQSYNENWLPLLGDVKEKLIYEIGSGNGNLIAYLANKGAFCTGTEISENRSYKLPQENLEWHNTDGVNLTEYEQAAYYDIVISDQVIEHLHPDDIDLHFKNVNKILKTGGQYIFYTPHYYIGPGDVSRIFGCIEAEGMHLKEYKYVEIYRLLKSAGFTKIDIPVNLKVNQMAHPLFYKKLFLFLEQCLMLISNISLRKRIYHHLIRPFHISHEIVIKAQK